jgi:ABC-type transport system involved in multi-copper enzyme maturation permease subunit
MRFPGPVFSKEVWMLGKRPSTSWFRLVHVVVLLFVVAMVFIAMSTGRSAGAAASLQRYQELAPAVTMAVVWVEFVMLTLIAVALSGPAVCDEKRMGTLGTLLTTPLQAWQIVLGKGLGRLVELLILALVPLPLLLALRSFGGVTAEALLTMTITCIANAMLAVQVGIFISTVSRRATGAIILSLITLAGVMFLPMLITWAIIMTQALTTSGSGNPGAFATGVLVTTCAPFTLGVQAFHYLFGESTIGRLPVPVLHIWGIHIAYTLALWLLFFWLSCIVLRRAMVLEGAGRTVEPKQAKPKHRAAATPVPGSDLPPADAPAHAALPAPRARPRRARAPEGSSRVVGDSPVLWRELQQAILRSRALTILAALLIAAVLLFAYYLSGFEEPVQQVITAIGSVVAILACAVLSTGTISQERESRTLDALLCTPLPARDIVWGKFLGAARRAAPLLAIILVHVFVSGVCAKPGAKLCNAIDTFIPKFSYRNNSPETANPIALLHVAIILGSSMAFLLATGVLFSARFKKSTSATVCNVALALALWAAAPFSVFMVTETALDSFNDLGDFAQNMVVAANPVPMATIAVDGAQNVEWSSGSVSRRSLRYDMPNGDWDPVSFTIVMAVVGAAYCSGAWVALRLAARTLATPTARAK